MLVGMCPRVDAANKKEVIFCKDKSLTCWYEHSPVSAKPLSSMLCWLNLGPCAIKLYGSVNYRFKTNHDQTGTVIGPAYNLLKLAIPGLFYFIFVFSTQLTVNKSLIKVCRWLDSNRGSLVLEATALPLSHNHCPPAYNLIKEIMIVPYVSRVLMTLCKEYDSIVITYYRRSFLISATGGTLNGRLEKLFLPEPFSCLFGGHHHIKGLFQLRGHWRPNKGP